MVMTMDGLRLRQPMLSEKHDGKMAKAGYSILSPSQQAKQYGCKSVVQVSRAIGVPVRTLYDWQRDKPTLYQAVCEWTVSKEIECTAQ